MRPDPYKRAKSRQYKIKHGIIDSKIATKQESVLPSNIPDEKFALDIVSDDQDGICLNFDGMDLSFGSNKVLDKSRYKYTNELYEKVFEFKDKSADNPTSSPISKHLSQKLSLPELYFNEKKTRITINDVKFSENFKSGGAPQLKLRKDECDFEGKNSHDKVKMIANDKLDLEDWLDQIL